MVGQILRIKTTIPPLGRHTISRPLIKDKLVENLQVEEGFARPLSLFSAPAGFGKTTLVRQWMSGREGETAWLSLDEEDNDPERFWIYLVSALQHIVEKTGRGTMEAFRNQGHFPDPSAGRESLLTPLLNDLFALEKPVSLVLDDYYLIDNSRIHEDMIFFIENLPPTLHLVVATRSDPPWPLSRWRVKGKMAEIRLEDLKFSEEEAKTFFAGIKGLSLHEEQLQRLYQKTEGWITGLQLAASSLAASGNKDEFIASFAGSHRHIFHFLTEEVISRQPVAVQDFLLKTSILHRFSAALCDRVTGREDSGALLSRLERDNLFVIPLDENGSWYRYHPLFADLLSYQLKARHGAQVRELHEKASRWFSLAGEYGEAVRHALAAENHEEAARILHDQYAVILFQEELGPLNRYLERLAPDLLEKFPRLMVQKGLFYLVHKGSREARVILDAAEKLGYDHELEQKEYRGMLTALQAYYQIYNRQMDRALELAAEALQLLPKNNYYWRMNVAIYSGDARLFSGNPREALPFYQEADLNSSQMKSGVFSLTTFFKLGTSLLSLGRLEEAEQYAREGLQMARNNNLARVARTGLLWALLGGLQQEKGNLDEAGRCLERSLFLSEPEKPSLAWNSLQKVSLASSRGLNAQAWQEVQKIEAIDREWSLPFFITAAAETWKARILLDRGDEAGAGDVLKELGVTSHRPVQGGLEEAYLLLGRLLKLKGPGSDHTGALVRIIDELTALAREGQNTRVLLETMLLKAGLAEEAGKSTEAEEHLEEALRLGRGCGYFQLFVDRGRDLLSLWPRMARAVTAGSAGAKQAERVDLAAYAAKIMDALAPGEKTAPGKKESRGEGQEEEGANTARAEKKASFELVEKLSPRELEILDLISRGCSNDDIARRLFLSLGTVKWHTTNIFGKLGVRSRTRAVALARDLQIIA